MEHLKYNFTLKKLICKDYTVSRENFDLLYDDVLEMYYTHPQPNTQKLPHYYKSENYISHTDSNKKLLDRIYQEVKKYTIGKKVALLESFETNQNYLLDVGCGTGDFLKTATLRSWKIAGVEPNLLARQIASKKLGDSCLLVLDIDKLLAAKQPPLFDVITLWHVLEHIPDFNSYIAKLKSLLKKDGYLLVAVPNYKSYDAKHYQEYWAAYDVPRHLWHFSQNSISKIFDKHQMQVTIILPMRFDSYYVSLLSEKYKTGKSNFIKAFWHAFLSNWKARKSSEYSSLIYIIKNK